MAARERLPAGALLVTREGHLFTRHAISFHAPDSELHGVLTRQREIEELGTAMQSAQAEVAALRNAAGAAEQDVESDASGSTNCAMRSATGSATSTRCRWKRCGWANSTSGSGSARSRSTPNWPRSKPSPVLTTAGEQAAAATDRRVAG